MDYGLRTADCRLRIKIGCWLPVLALALALARKGAPVLPQTLARAGIFQLTASSVFLDFSSLLFWFRL